MMNDIIETYKGCIIQHGKMNNRIYLMKILPSAENPLSDIVELAEKKGYTKIFAKIPEQRKDEFLNSGFVIEASIPDFYNDGSKVFFMGYFPCSERKHEDKKDIIENNLAIALEKGREISKKKLDSKFSIRPCKPQDTEAMAEVYKKVFPTYPFPVHDPAYLEETMKTHIDYFCVEHENMIIALSSAEKDISQLNAEMTDFATLPEWRGNGFGQELLSVMEEKIQKEGIKTPFTIARAMSAGMNIVFSRAGYTYGGRLVNNTNISGNIESMNVWYKSLK